MDKPNRILLRTFRLDYNSWRESRPVHMRMTLSRIVVDENKKSPPMLIEAKTSAGHLHGFRIDGAFWIITNPSDDANKKSRRRRHPSAGHRSSCE